MEGMESSEISTGVTVGEQITQLSERCAKYCEYSGERLAIFGDDDDDDDDDIIGDRKCKK